MRKAINKKWPGHSKFVLFQASPLWLSRDAERRKVSSPGERILVRKGSELSDYA